MKTLKEHITLAAIAFSALCSCGKMTPYEGDFDHVMIYMGSAYNNLSSSIRSDLVKELCAGEIPRIDSRDAIVAFIHNTQQDAADYKTPVSPCVIRLYKNRDKVILDTVKVYGSKTVDPSPETVRSVLGWIGARYPAKHYGLLYSSHGTGWLPAQHYSGNMAAPYDRDEPTAVPASVGSQFDVEAKYTYELDIRDMAKCIPMHLDYLIFDACLMGGIEVAYELRESFDFMVASPTEILSAGLYYDGMAARLLMDKPDLQGLCQDYIDHCSQGTIGLYDSRGLEGLAKTCRTLTAAHREGILDARPSRIQRYYRGNHPWFFDLRDIYAEAGADEAEMAMLDAALDKAVPYKGYTSDFLEISIDRSCGMSMFLPKESYSSGELLDYYRTLAWNKATLLVE